MKKIIPIIVCLLLLAACGQSYEETKRMTREQRREAAQKDSAALKIAVMPTLDCLPLFVAAHYELFDTLRGGVRLKYYTAQMDCDTALLRRRVEMAISDIVRVEKWKGEKGPSTPSTGSGTVKVKPSYVTATNAYWLLIGNRNQRISK